MFQLPGLFKAIAKSNLFIASKNENQTVGSEFEPLFFEQNDTLLVTAFSSLSLPSLHGHITVYVWRLTEPNSF